MADYNDVMNADANTDHWTKHAATLAREIEEDEVDEERMGAVLVAQSNLAVAAAIQALGVRIDNALGDFAAHVGRV